MSAVKGRAIILVAIAGALLGAALWSTLAWVPYDGALWLWSANTGSLRVAGRGVAVMPRWSGSRLGPRELRAQVSATTSDGVAADVTVSVQPAVGELRLAPAETPGEGLGLTVAEPVRRELARVSLACLESPEMADCAGDPAAELRGWMAVTLRTPEDAVEVRIEADAGALRAGVLREMAGRLDLRQRKVLLLALDGLDWHYILPLVEAGRMPNLEALMKAGTWGQMETIVPILSPLIWTTVATGVEPEVHGILDFLEIDPGTGQQVPITGRGRKVPAIWNLASAMGLEVGVVGWWGSWPAERVNGTMVSDRLYSTLREGVDSEMFRQDPPDLVFPANRSEKFVTIRDRAVMETGWQTLRYFMDVPEEAFDRAVAEDRGLRDPIDGMRRLVAATRTYMAAGLTLAAERPDLLMVYIEGTDGIGHVLAPYMDPPTIEVNPAEAAIYAAAVPRYFEIIDRWIGRYLEVCPLTEYVVLVVSDHGFKWGEDRPTGLMGMGGATAGLWHAEDAAFVITGSDITARGRVERWSSVYDVAPTIAALLGLPADTGWRPDLLPGCPAARTEPVEWASLVPPASYTQSGGGVAPVDPEAIDMLKALGYLSEDGTTSAAAATPASVDRPSRLTDLPATPTPRTSDATIGELNNLGILKANQKKYDEAEKIFRQLIEMDPNYSSPHYNLRRIYFETGQYDRADEELWNAIDKGFRDPERTIDRAAADYERFEMPERADALLTRAIEYFPEHEPFYVHLMVVKLRTDRCDEGVPIGAVAVEKFPWSGPAHAFYGLSAACAGQPELAKGEIERALEINPDQPSLRQALAELKGQG
jgi:tetratricopeptide (TPR) repeat protein